MLHTTNGGMEGTFSRLSSSNCLLPLISDLSKPLLFCFTDNTLTCSPATGAASKIWAVSLLASSQSPPGVPNILISSVVELTMLCIINGIMALRGMDMRIWVVFCWGLSRLLIGVMIGCKYIDVY